QPLQRGGGGGLRRPFGDAGEVAGGRVVERGGFVVAGLLDDGEVWTQRGSLDDAADRADAVPFLPLVDVGHDIAGRVGGLRAGLLPLRVAVLCLRRLPVCREGEPLFQHGRRDRAQAR